MSFEETCPAEDSEIDGSGLCGGDQAAGGPEAESIDEERGWLEFLLLLTQVDTKKYRPTKYHTYTVILRSTQHLHANSR